MCSVVGTGSHLALKYSFSCIRSESIAIFFFIFFSLSLSPKKQPVCHYFIEKLYEAKDSVLCRGHPRAPNTHTQSFSRHTPYYFISTMQFDGMMCLCFWVFHNEFPPCHTSLRVCMCVCALCMCLYVTHDFKNRMHFDYYNCIKYIGISCPLLCHNRHNILCKPWF